MDEHRRGLSLKAPGSSGSPLRLPGREPFPPIDEHLVVPELTRDEMIGGRRVVAMPAQLPHAAKRTDFSPKPQRGVGSLSARLLPSPLRGFLGWRDGGFLALKRQALFLCPFGAHPALQTDHQSADPAEYGAGGLDPWERSTTASPSRSAASA